MAGGPTACVPGASVACVGPGACQGGQVCLPDGSGYGPCDCGGAGSGGGGQGGEGGAPVCPAKDEAGKVVGLCGACKESPMSVGDFSDVGELGIPITSLDDAVRIVFKKASLTQGESTTLTTAGDCSAAVAKTTFSGEIDARLAMFPNLGESITVKILFGSVDGEPCGGGELQDVPVTGLGTFAQGATALQSGAMGCSDLGAYVSECPVFDPASVTACLVCDDAVDEKCKQRAEAAHARVTELGRFLFARAMQRYMAGLGRGQCPPEKKDADVITCNGPSWYPVDVFFLFLQGAQVRHGEREYRAVGAQPGAAARAVLVGHEAVVVIAGLDNVVDASDGDRVDGLVGAKHGGCVRLASERRGGRATHGPTTDPHRGHGGRETRGGRVE